MKNTSRMSWVLAFIVAVVVATVWGSVVQTQFNMSALNRIGAGISGDVRLQATLRDIFSGFTPTYGGYIVLPSLLVAFLVASWVARRSTRRARLAWFAAAGGLAILLGNPVVNFLSPLALLVGATRDVSCLVLMSLGGVAAGVLFAVMHRPPTHVEPTPHVGGESFAR
jgi:hypothetical protein